MKVRWTHIIIIIKLWNSEKLQPITIIIAAFAPVVPCPSRRIDGIFSAFWFAALLRSKYRLHISCSCFLSLCEPQILTVITDGSFVTRPRRESVAAEGAVLGGIHRTSTKQRGCVLWLTRMLCYLFSARPRQRCIYFIYIPVINIWTVPGIKVKFLRIFCHNAQEFMRTAVNCGL